MDRANRRPSWKWLQRRLRSIARGFAIEDRRDRESLYYDLAEWLSERYPSVALESWYDSYSGATEVDLNDAAKAAIWETINSLPPRIFTGGIIHNPWNLPFYDPPLCVCAFFSRWQWRDRGWINEQRILKMRSKTLDTAP